MRAVLRSPQFILGLVIYLATAGNAAAQQSAPPPAYLAVVEGIATLERDGEAQPAVVNMPFVAGDRVRTAAGRVEIDFPDGSAIEIGSYSEVEALSATRVRLIAGTMDHLPRHADRATSSSYLPTELKPYASTLDQYGSWNYDTVYGYVWYPQVAGTWRPYYYGSWASVPSYGWTWVGVDAWSWPTHHYGRWGYARDAWFWIPGRTWSTAWVSWGVAPNFVSWCPLGFDGRPVFGLSVGGRLGTGWTVMSRDHFGYRGHYAHDYAVDARRVDARTDFVQTSRLPSGFGRASGKFAPPPSHVEKRAPGSTGGVAVVPPAGTAVGAAVPRGSANAPAPPPVEYHRGTPNPGPRVPQGAPNPSKGEQQPPRYSPAVPGTAPRAVDQRPAPAVEPSAPPAATPVVPPVAKPIAAPPPPPPAKGAAPASGGVVRHAPGSPPPAPAAAGKAESAPAKRPR